MNTTTWNTTEPLDWEGMLEAAEMYRQIHSARSKEDFVEATSTDAKLKRPTFETITIPELRNKLGRKWRQGMRNLTKLAFILEKVQLDTKLSDSVIIAQTSPKWMELLGVANPNQAFRIVNQAVAVDLLRLRTPAEYYNHTAASYWVNHKMATMLLEESDDPEFHCNPVVKQVSDTLRKYLSGKFLDETCKATPISIRSQCKLPPMTDEDVIRGIYEQYPQYLDLLLTLCQINSMLPKNEAFLCSPSVDRDKAGNVIRIGLRAHNPWCHVKKREGLEKVNPHEMYREDLLDGRFGHWVEYDIKACVPSVSLLLTTGRWRDDGEDLYEFMSGIRFGNKAERDLFKGLFLPMYFNATPEQAVARSRSKARCHCIQYTEDEWNNLTNVFFTGMARMTTSIGRLGSEVFLHESCIEANSLLRMLKMGWQVVNVYDGFFIKTDGTEEDAKVKREMASRIVKEEAEGYFRRWFGKEGNPTL